MTLALSVSEDGWELAVSDQGGGDPSEVRELIGNDDTPALDDERGRGFFLLGQMLHSLRVEKSHDGLGLTFHAVHRYARPA